MNLNNKCRYCEHDCYQYTENDNCRHFKLAKAVSEYIRIIKAENRNLHKFCKQNGLKYSELMKMLRYKERFRYKYRKLLEEFLYESDEWIDFKMEEVRNEEKEN
jgi:hypothetical protein